MAFKCANFIERMVETVYHMSNDLFDERFKLTIHRSLKVERFSSKMHCFCHVHQFQYYCMYMIGVDDFCVYDFKW